MPQAGINDVGEELSAESAKKRSYEQMLVDTLQRYSGYMDEYTADLTRAFRTIKGLEDTIHTKDAEIENLKTKLAQFL